MNSLILDTSTDLCIISIAENDQITAQEIFAHNNQLSETLLPTLQSMVEKHCGSPKNLFAIAFGIGPGSYTGTRLGVAVAKSLAFGLTVPIKTFPSPLAFLPYCEGTFAFIIPCRSGQFYVLLGSQAGAKLYAEKPLFMTQEELDKLAKVDFFIYAQQAKIPEVIKNKPYFAPTPNLRVLNHWLSDKEHTPLENIELVYLGNP